MCGLDSGSNVAVMVLKHFVCVFFMLLYENKIWGNNKIENSLLSIFLAFQAKSISELLDLVSCYMYIV